MIEVKNGNLATKNTFQLIHLCEKLNAESKVNHAGNSVLKNKIISYIIYKDVNFAIFLTFHRNVCLISIYR